MRIAAIILVLLSSGVAAAETHDYLLVFSADRQPYKPTKAHTFAAVVRIETDPGCPPRVVHFASLSWLPETMKVRALALWHEKGRNVPLDETLQVFQATGSRICLWGPYRIQPELADTFRARVNAVESGFAYKGACILSPRHVCDCARSVEEMLTFNHRRYIGVFGYGAAAASVIVQKFSPWLIEPEQCHHWVEPLIGVDSFAIIHRPYGDYTSRLDQAGAWLHGN